MNTLLSLRIIGGWIPWILCALSAALIAALLLRRPTARWLLRACLGILSGVVVALALVLFFNAAKTFEITLPPEVAVWAAATLGAVGLAVVSLWRSRWWHKTVAVFGIVVFAIAGTVQVNAAFDLNPTVGDLLGVSVARPIALPPLSRTPAPDPAAVVPLYDSWVAPADMPKHGEAGTEAIPATASGFSARPAGIYLPPAALVKNPPALPLLIMMMGYPGNPDPSGVAGVMGRFAAAHHGLAPIVVVADQIGHDGDPACADSTARGDAATYVKTDVLTWAKTHLNVIQDPDYWVLAGYSNGAVCAMKYGAQAPQTFRRILAVSPELFPGMNYSATVIHVVYDGDRARWQADKPAKILAANAGGYTDSMAVVTTGALDTEFGPASRELAGDARQAGMEVALLTIPGVGHVGANMRMGLTAGLQTLSRVLGLAPR